MVDGKFGVDLDLQGTLLAVGSMADQAYLYEYDGAQWQETILVAPTPWWEMSSAPRWRWGRWSWSDHLGATSSRVSTPGPCMPSVMTGRTGGRR